MKRAKAKEDLHERLCMAHVEKFLGSYRETLAQEVASGGLWPEELAQFYEPECCLKHSGAKEVYLAIDRRTGGRVVLRASDLDAGERADVEHAILSHLNFPGIPKTYGTFVKDGRSYLLREYFDGEPLDQVIARGTLSPQQIYQLTRQICAILGYLHKQTPPVIHRDIKPQNIIVRPDGSLGLTDFGIARTYKEGSDSDTQYMGTQPYAPPELYGYSQSSPQTDIYALGIVLIFLATGSHDRRHLSERIADKKLLELIEHCIAFDPDDRFLSTEEVCTFIDKGRRAKSKAKRRRTKVLAALVSALAIFLVAGGVFVYTDPLGWVTALSNSSSQEDPESDGLEALDNQGPLFNSSLTGNLTSNILVGGFAVEGENEVYVALKDGIYVLEDDGSIGRQVIKVYEATNLNYHQGMLYYIDRSFNLNIRGIRCLDPQTGEAFTLDDNRPEYIYFDNGTLYYRLLTENDALYAVALNGSGTTKVRDLNVVGLQDYFIADGYLYYKKHAGDYTFYRQNIASGREEVITEDSVQWASVYDSRLYAWITARVVTIDLKTKEAEELLNTSGNVALIYKDYSFLNATPLGVFFRNNYNSSIELVSHDGLSTTVKVKEGCGEFCVTRDWIIYINRGDAGNLWAMSMDGSINVRLEAQE